MTILFVEITIDIIDKILQDLNLTCDPEQLKKPTNDNKQANK